uniref:NADH-ubiquinone oxidoreductase chain 4 n=1 Tax=Leucosolenia complicata TaxID=433461 RepID=A0A140CUS6_9METZ|nr:NADH dehydrogenase subunit 4 [Leucosolenia complicata]
MERMGEAFFASSAQLWADARGVRVPARPADRTMGPLLSFLLTMCWGLVLRSWSGAASGAHLACVAGVQAGCWAFFRAGEVQTLFASFEVAGLSVFAAVGFFGARERRAAAALHFAGYSVASAMMLLVAWMDSLLRGSPGGGWEADGLSPGMSMALTATFLTKLPAVPFHSWLPRAHVEASLGGSVLLASVLLKLGAHGLAWMRSDPAPSGAMGALAFWGLSTGTFFACRQTEAKRFAACTSVAHMATVVASFSADAMEAVVLIAVTHGLAGPLLFFWATATGDRWGTRDLVFCRGLGGTAPLFSGFLLASQAASWGAAPVGAFLGEMAFARGVVAMDLGAGIAALSLCAAGRVALLAWHARAVGGPAPVASSFFRDSGAEETLFFSFWISAAMAAGCLLPR